MLQVRRSEERGAADHGWLKSWHTFSFANYFDPKHMGFRSLRVINEDRIAGGTGFGAHPHRDMEIITYVVSGALQHKDSMGNSAVIRPNEVQRMTAGTGVVHSEHSLPGEETHLFQIWILPEVIGDKPGYGQKSFENELNTQKMVHVVSKDGRNGSIGINQDADMYISRLKSGDEVEHKLRSDRGAWVQIVKGEFTINGKKVSAGDALSFENEELIQFKAEYDGEFILFDLA